MKGVVRKGSFSLHSSFSNAIFVHTSMPNVPAIHLKIEHSFILSPTLMRLCTSLWSLIARRRDLPSSISYYAVSRIEPPQKTLDLSWSTVR